MCISLHIVFCEMLIDKLFHSQIHSVNIQVNVFIVTVETLGVLNVFMY